MCKKFVRYILHSGVVDAQVLDVCIGGIGFAKIVACIVCVAMKVRKHYISKA